jgi:hypothetical protein
MDERKKMYSYRLPFPLQFSDKILSPSALDVNSYRQSRMEIKKDSVLQEENTRNYSSSFRVRHNDNINTF